MLRQGERGRDLQEAQRQTLGGPVHRRYSVRREARSVYARTKAAVVAKLKKAIAEADRGINFEAENLALGEYLERWIEDSVKGSVWHTTYRDYRGHVCNHIAPEIGRVKLAKLTPAHVQALYRKKTDSGLSSRTVNYIHATLHKALEQAVKWRLIQYNVSDAAVKPRQERRETVALTLDQVYDFLDAARDAEDRFEALYVTAVFTGMRPGELLALRWTDLVLDGPEPEARVRRSLSKDDHGRRVFKRTKTEKGRSVYLMPEVVEALRTHRRRQTEERLLYSGLWKDQDLVFPNQTGSPMDWDNINRAKLQAPARCGQLARDHPLLRSPAHLRHAHVGAGREPEGGAGDPGALPDHTHTMDTYSHVTPSMQRAAFGRLGERLQR